MAVIALVIWIGGVGAGGVAIVADVAEVVPGFAVYAWRREVLVPVLGDAAGVQVANNVTLCCFQVEWQLTACSCYDQGSDEGLHIKYYNKPM